MFLPHPLKPCVYCSHVPFRPFHLAGLKNVLFAHTVTSNLDLCIGTCVTVMADRGRFTDGTTPSKKATGLCNFSWQSLATLLLVLLQSTGGWRQ